MKILLLHDFSDGIGGGELHVHQLTKLLRNNGLEVDTYYGAKKNSLISTITSFFNIKHFVKLSYILKKDPSIKVLHLHGTLYNLSPSIYLLKIFFDIRIIQTIHAFQYYCPRSFGIYEDGSICKYGFNNTKCLYKNCESYFVGRRYFIWYFYKWLKILINRYFIRRYVDTFICPSRAIKEYMIRTLDLPLEKAVYLPNFIEYNSTNVPDFENIIEQKFLFVGRLSKVKGVHVAIKAINILVKSHGLRDLQLEVIGDGPERKDLEILVNKLGLNYNIKFLGKIDNNKLNTYYESAMAVIVPSIWLEAFGLVNLEAMKYGKPIIGSNVGGIPDLIEDGKNGYLFPLGNHVELARYIKELYKNKDKSIKMGKYGYTKLISDFSTESFYKQLIKLYT